MIEKPIQLKDTHLITNPEHVAEYMNNHFCNIGTSLGLEDSSPSSVTINHHTNLPNSFALFPITETEVINAIMKLKPNKSPGPDNVHPKFLKLCSKTLAKPFKILFVMKNTHALPIQKNMAPIQYTKIVI